MTSVDIAFSGKRPEWPHQLLDVDALLAGGWRPLALTQFVVKVHGRCNLACDYCYVYRSADQSWRGREARMSEPTMFRTAERIAEHAEAHGLEAVSVVLHGGEPLLAGAAAIDFLARSVRAAMPTGTQVRLSVQTNGTLVDDAMLDVFDRHDIRVGVSLDGLPAAHDEHRPSHRGRGSHRSVERGLRCLRSPRYRHLYSGLLCVVDPAQDPVETYESLLAHEPPAIDFLFPHANWADPPRRPAGSATPHGDWLVTAFDRWYGAPRREASVRIFDEVVRLLLGRPSRVESIGLTPARLAVVETDGAIEHVDALKSAYEGAASTGLNVHDDPFDTALGDPQVVARQIGVEALADDCRRCDVHHVCGGGYYPHRYRPATGFRHPSVYCGDLSRLIRHVHARVARDLAHARRDRPPA